jgi:tetratricopeptide (TPR) repeat protein
MLKYPLSLKLLLLKCNFNILINYENNYDDGEKNLNEIIEIQLYLKSSNYHLASSKFHMAKIKYYFKNYDEAERYALEAKNLFENANDNNKKNNKNEEDIEKKVTQNVSNILSLLAQIYLIKNQYKEAAKCYENGYYLNLGRFGAENDLTLFFKNKMDLMNEELKKFTSQQPKTQVIVNQNNHNINTNDNSGNNNFIGNIMHKGKAETFSFKIPTSSLYEPFLLSIYSIGQDDSNRFAPELFLGNLCFDKQKLAKYLRLRGNNFNAKFYTDDNLNKILGNIMYYNGNLSFLDNKLRNCLISSSIQ